MLLLLRLSDVCREKAGQCSIADSVWDWWYLQTITCRKLSTVVGIMENRCKGRKSSTTSRYVGKRWVLEKVGRTQLNSLYCSFDTIDNQCSQLKKVTFRAPLQKTFLYFLNPDGNWNFSQPKGRNENLCWKCGLVVGRNKETKEGKRKI